MQQQARLLEFQREREREQPQERELPRLLQALQLACCALVWQLVLELLEQLLQPEPVVLQEPLALQEPLVLQESLVLLQPSFPRLAKHHRQQPQQALRAPQLRQRLHP